MQEFDSFDKNDKKIEALDFSGEQRVFNNKLKYQKVKNVHDDIVLGKLNVLNLMLSSMMSDSNSTILDSEPKMKNVYTDEEHALIKEKIFKLINNW